MMQVDDSEPSVEFRSFKKWATRNLDDYFLGKLVQIEPDIMPAGEYIAKLPVWLNLYDLEKEAKE